MRHRETASSEVEALAPDPVCERLRFGTGVPFVAEVAPVIRPSADGDSYTIQGRRALR